MKNQKNLQAFTLIEMAVVFAIIAIGVGIAFGTLLTARPRIKVRGDLWSVNQIVMKARMTSISENANYGIAFYRTGSDPNYIYNYFIFKDSNSDDQFTDLDSNPLHQCEFVGQTPPGNCTLGGEDPIIGISAAPPTLSSSDTASRVVPTIYTLDPSNFFAEIFGETLEDSVISVVFDPLGRPNRGGEIVIQSNTLYSRNPPISYAGRIRINQATGISTRFPPALTPHP